MSPVRFWLNGVEVNGKAWQRAAAENFKGYESWEMSCEDEPLDSQAAHSMEDPSVLKIAGVVLLLWSICGLLAWWAFL